MDCPKCIGKLEKKIVEGVEVDVCWVCEGIWFDKDELEKVIELDSKNFDTVDTSRECLDGNEAADLNSEVDTKPGMCPRCADGTIMKRKDYRMRIYDDECPKCSGIWLDGGEIHKIRKRQLVNIYKKLCSFKDKFLMAMEIEFNSRRKKNKKQKNDSL